MVGKTDVLEYKPVHRRPHVDCVLVSGGYIYLAVAVILRTAAVRPGFDPTEVHVRFVVDTKAAVKWLEYVLCADVWERQ